MKKAWMIVVLVSLATNIALIAFLLGSRGALRSGRDDAPVLLRRIVAIGKLHTVRATFERTGSLESFRNANPGVAWIPGVEELVNAATRNAVVMTLRGSVETGVDFRKIGLVRRGEVVEVTLPPVEVYEPTVSAELHDLKSGMFWRDETIELKAIESAKREFRNAAIKAGARETAIAEAKGLVEGMLRSAGVKQVIFAG